jgi:hypothetical protein
LAADVYRLRGKVLRSAGTRDLQIFFISLDANDAVIGQSTPTLSPSTSYTDFDVEVNVLPGAVSAKLEFKVLTGSPATVICLDELSLEGPPLATPTPLPTDTPPPSATGTSSPVATATATATRTPQPSLVFRNGSFEDGAFGWQHFGGELDVTRATKVSGLQSGVLTSNTASTKWAYQTVLVDPAHHYEFKGYLQPAAGVANSLLRISWYGTPDGTGEALSTIDSTATVPGGAPGYVWVTTGPVQPPPGARTARTRVLLTPEGAGPAALFMDDLEFITAVPAAATPVPPTVAALSPTSTPAPSLAVAPTRTNALAAVATSSPLPSPEATRVADVSSIRVVATPTAVSEVQGVLNEAPPGDDGGLPLIWLVGAGALVAGLGGAYVQGRRKT